MSRIQGQGDNNLIHSSSSRPARSKCSRKQDHRVPNLATVSDEVTFHNVKDSFTNSLHSIQNVGTLVVSTLDYEAKINVENLTNDTLYFKVRSTAPEKFQVVPTFGLITSKGIVRLTVRVTPTTIFHTIKYEKFQVQLMKAPQDLLSQACLVAKLNLMSKSELPELGRSLSSTLNQLWTKYKDQGVHVESHCVSIHNPRASLSGNDSKPADIKRSPEVPHLTTTIFDEPLSEPGPDEGNFVDDLSNGVSELEAQARAILNCGTKKLIEKNASFFEDSKGKSLLEKIEKLEQCAAKLEESSCQVFAWLRRTIVVSIVVTTVSLLLVSFSDGSATYSEVQPKQCSLREASLKQQIPTKMSTYGKLKGKVLSKDYYDNKVLQSIWEFFPFVFRINDNVIPGQSAFKILEAVCKERGWKEFGVDEHKYQNTGANILGWNLWWRTAVMMHTQNRSLYSWQYTNHIPKAINFCNKEYLASYIRIMEDYFGQVYRFCPLTFTLPKEHEEFGLEHEQRSQISLLEEAEANFIKNLIPNFSSDSDVSLDGNASDKNGNKMDDKNGNVNDKNGNVNDKNGNVNDKNGNVNDKNGNVNEKTENSKLKPVWICKPVGKSQGKGICLIDNLTNLPDHPVTIVQEYIAKPLLISGHKFDLRLYVCIVSVSPLTIYAYREGLTRFATEPYNLADLDRSYSHLTNSSINKLGPGYEIDKTGIGHGCKWTLRKLRQRLEQEGETDWFMWQRIMSIIVLTILGEVGQQVGFSSTKNNFEFLGYDVLIDENLRPWLLETNLSPGLGGDCDVDEIVKKPMLHQLFDLLGLPDGRPYLSLVAATNSSIKASDNSIVHVDVPTNTAIKLTTETELKAAASPDSGTSIETPTKSPEETLPRTPSDEFGHAVATLADKSRKINSQLTKKSKISWGLRKRLLDVSAIYSQKLQYQAFRKRRERDSFLASPKNAIALISEELSNEETARLNFLASTDWVGVKDPNNGTGSTIPHRPGIGLKKRSWYDAPARHGDWIRIYPFDYLSFQMSRGHMSLDIKDIVDNMEKYLNFAEQLVLKRPGLSDEMYGQQVREVMSWNRILWHPPK